MVDTSRDLLIAASEIAPLATNTHNTIAVYSLANYGLDGYLLRTEIGGPLKFKDRLTSSSIITPVYLTGANVGQARLIVHTGQAEIGQIISQLPGVSLHQIYDKYKREFQTQGLSLKEAELNAYGAVYNILMNVPVESFVELMKTIKSLTRDGVAVDSHWSNYLYHNGRLYAIDVIADPQASRNIMSYANSLNNLTEGLSGNYHVVFGSDLIPQDIATNYAAEIQAIRDTIARAGEQAKIPTSEQEVNRLAGQHGRKGGQFHVIHVGMGSQLPLDTVPEDLRRTLIQVEQYKPGTFERRIWAMGFHGGATNASPIATLPFIRGTSSQAR